MTHRKSSVSAPPAAPETWATEQMSPRFTDLDAWPLADQLAALLEGQFAAVAAVRPALPVIEAAVREAAQRLGNSGRLVFVGAGTSGRIAVQDGAELPPTFGWPRERLLLLMAGGPEALMKSVEGAEDSREAGIRAIEAAGLQINDVVIGVAASGTTPFTLAALEAADRRGALVIALSANRGTPLLAIARHKILLETGPEPIAGSTRLKAGTAQKIALNLFSTALMVELGRVYRGLMVEMAASNEKLKSRAERMVARLAGVQVAAARSALQAGGGDIKLAVLIASGLDLDEANARLRACGGRLRLALKQPPEPCPQASSK